MRPKNKAGFTLIEILFALFIFAILALLMTGALHHILNIEAASDKKAAQLADLQTTLLLFSRDITGAIDRPVVNNVDKTLGFIAAPDSATFTHTGLANPFGRLARSTLQRVSWRLRDGQLQRLTWGSPDVVASTQPAVRVMLTGIQALHFRFLDNKNLFYPVWPPPAGTPQALPRGVEISIQSTAWGHIAQFYLLPQGKNDAP